MLLIYWLSCDYFGPCTQAIDQGILLSKDGKGRLFFRGTNPRKVKDLMTDLKIVTGKIRSTDHYKTLKKLAKEALEKYGKDLDVSGYSLGGAMSYTIGQELGIKSLSLNPLIASNVVSDLGPQNIVKNVAREFAGGYGAGIDNRGFKINADHQILRTLDDPVSLLLAYSKLPSNARIDTITGDLTSLSPLDWHFLKNFYKKKHENVNWRDKTDAEMKAAVEKHSILVKKFGEYLTLQNMKDSVKKGLTLKEHMSMEDKGDINRLGKFGDRPVRQYYELWRKAGGKLSGLEAKEIRSRGGKIRNSDINKELDSKTKAFESAYMRDKLTRDIMENGARMRNLKEKNALVSLDNEKKMVKKINSAKDVELKQLRKQYDLRLKDLNSEAILKRGKRVFPSPDDIKRNILRQKMKVGRLKNRIKRQKAEKRQKKIREEQEKRSAKRAKKEADRQTLRDKFKDRLKKNLSGVAEDRQIRLLQRNEARRLRREKSPNRKLNIEPGDETKTEEVTMGTFENSAKKIREARDGRMAEFARKSAPFVNRPTNIEASAKPVLTSDKDATAFLNKSKEERLKEIAKFNEKQEQAIKDLDAKVPVPREGISFKRMIQDELRGNLKLLPASIAASVGTNALFQALDPDDKFTDTTGGQLTEGGISGLGTAGIMSALGMDVGGALGLAEFGVGGALGQAASQAVGNATYSALRNAGMDNRGASTLSGAASGGTFAGVAGASALATRKAGQAIAKALATEEESETGIEMTGEGAEGIAEGIGEGGEILEDAELAGEVGAELGPLGLAAGLIVGAGFIKN
eukprot:g4369.t1